MRRPSLDAARGRVRRLAPVAFVLLAPISWVFRGIFRGETYALSWWYAYDPVFAAARDFDTPARAPTIWDPSPSALNSVADRFSAESLASFELPLWNPYHALGMPLLAEVHPVVLSPLRLLLSFPLGGGDVGTTVLMISQLALASIGAYGWLRASDRSKEASLVAAAAYPFVGGAIAALHFTTTAGTTSLPFMLWAGELLVRKPTLGSAARFGLAAAFAAFVTHPSVAFMCGLGTALYVLVRALQPREQTTRVLSLAVLAAAITAGAASILILPFLEYMQHGWTYKQVVTANAVHLDTAAHLLLPPIESVTVFPVALLAVGALGLLSRSRTKWACLAMFLVAIGLVFELPGSRWLVRIPFQEIFGRAYIVLVACAGATGLFAAALDVLARRHRHRLLSVGICVAVIAACAVSLHHDGLLRRIDATIDPTSVRAAVASLLVVGLLALAFVSPAQRVRLAFVWVYLCVFLEVFPRASVHLQPEPRFDFPPTPALRFLQGELDAGERLISVGTWASHTNLTAHVPNVGLVTHLHDIRSADPLYVGRTHTLLDPMSARSWYAIHFYEYPEPRGHDESPTRPPTTMEMLGVRYALARPTASAPPHHVEVYRDEHVVVYENPRALPRAFVVHEEVHVATPADALAQLPSVDLSRVVIIDGRPPAPLPPAPAIDLGQEHVRIAGLEPRRVRLEATLAAEGYVVFSDAYYPGWTATLDGAPVTIFPANVAIRAVRVPAGEHRIEMRYEPASARIGGWLTLSALGLAVALLIRERRAQANR